MALILALQAESILNEGQTLNISDNSNWGEATYTRAEYGVFLVGEFRTEDTPEEVSIDLYDPITVAAWVANTPKNGRYSFTSYAFLVKNTIAPVLDVVNVDATDKLLYKYDGADWVEISLEDAIAEDSAIETSDVLDLPLLSYAYAYKNQLNLEYVAQVKLDIDRGKEQNKLYYKRTALDYYVALILAAEYNWSIGSFSYFYELTLNLNNIINTGKLS